MGDWNFDLLIAIVIFLGFFYVYAPGPFLAIVSLIIQGLSAVVSALGGLLGGKQE